MDRFNSMRATSSSPFQETDPTVPAWVKAITQSDISRWDEGGGGSTYTAGNNIQISNENVISATDTTYSAFTGTDGSTAGASGLVPAPATTDAGKYLKANGTWDSPSISQDDLGVIRYNGVLSLVDGSTPDLATNRFYAINGITVNSTADIDFNYSIIFYWKSGDDYYVDFVERYTGVSNPLVISKRYKYTSSAWSLTHSRSITYSTTDLTAGTSPLPTGSLYFVYE